jgi:hypothetical protein
VTTGLPPEADLSLVTDGLRRLRKRAALIPQAGFAETIAVTEVMVVPSGHCSAEARIGDGKPALWIDSGLLSALRLASLLVARHFDEGLFRTGVVDDETRASFARLFRAFLGQYYLFGRFRLDPPSLPDDQFGKLAGLIAAEAATFVIGHELGHVIAGHLDEPCATRWLDRSATTRRTHDAAQEIEADALAVAVALADLFGATVPEGLADLRLLAIRLSYELLSSVEHCYLVAHSRSHLPADERWEGVLHFLHRRFPPATLVRVSKGWQLVAEALRFPVTTNFEPPAVPVLDDLKAHHWPAPDIAAEGGKADWDMAEESSRQFRLDATFQYALIGSAVLGIEDLSAIAEGDLLAAGRAVVDELEAGLPRLLKGENTFVHATPGVGDLVRHLRLRQSWPEPFRSDQSLGLPIHLAAGAVAKRLTTGQSKSNNERPSSLPSSQSSVP